MNLNTQIVQPPPLSLGGSAFWLAAGGPLSKTPEAVGAGGFSLTKACRKIVINQIRDVGVYRAFAHCFVPLFRYAGGRVSPNLSIRFRHVVLLWVAGVSTATLACICVISYLWVAA